MRRSSCSKDFSPRFIDVNPILLMTIPAPASCNASRPSGRCPSSRHDSSICSEPCHPSGEAETSRIRWNQTRVRVRLMHDGMAPPDG